MKKRPLFLLFPGRPINSWQADSMARVPRLRETAWSTSDTKGTLLNEGGYFKLS